MINSDSRVKIRNGWGENLFTVILGHNFVEIDGADQIEIKVATRLRHAFRNRLEASEVDNGIESVSVYDLINWNTNKT